jgi:hypothetical protein
MKIKKKRNHSTRSSPVIGYAIVDKFGGNVATLGTACIIFGTHERAEAHKVEYHFPPSFVIEEARLSQLVACMVAGGAYVFDDVSAPVWNTSIVTHYDNHIKPFADRLGFNPPDAMLPMSGEYSLLKWNADSIIHQVARGYLLGKASQSAAQN